MTQGAVWYVVCRGQQLGPVDAGALIQLLRSGRVDGTASVSAPHLPGWVPISQEPLFAPHLPSAGHPSPVRAPLLPTGKWLRVAGWILLGIAAFFLLMVPLMAIDQTAEPDTWIGGIVAAVMFGLPGALLMWRGRKAAAKVRLVGFLTSRDRIRVPEVARMLAQPELETEQLLAQLNHELRLDLVYVPNDRQYVHRSRLSTTHQIPDRCPTCGAPTESQLVLQGERVTCKYCNSAVA